jgi:hypothetical protein
MEGDASCKDRAGRALTILEKGLSKFFSKYLFASAKNIASHFDISVSTMKDLLTRAGTPSIYSDMGAAFPIGVPEK